MAIIGFEDTRTGLENKEFGLLLKTGKGKYADFSLKPLRRTSPDEFIISPRQVILASNFQNYKIIEL